MLTGMTDAKSKCRWFSLRTLLVVVTLCAVPCGWLGWQIWQARRQRGAATGIEKADGTVLLTLEGFTLQLPLGSHHQAKQGEDSVCGTITLGKSWLTLDYDIGGMAGNYATNKLNPAEWRKHDENNGIPFDYSYSKNGEKGWLTVSFPQAGPANFVAKLNEPEDLDRILTVLRTLKPIGGEDKENL
jgi:hypothetical protein